MHLHIFDHYVQHKVCEAETQPYKNIQKYVAFHMPGLFKNISNIAACIVETGQNCFISHFVFGEPTY